MNDRERIAELERRIDQLERDNELSRLRLRDAAAAAQVKKQQIARLRDELERLRNRRSVRLALSASERVRPLAAAMSGVVASGRTVIRRGERLLPTRWTARLTRSKRSSGSDGGVTRATAEAETPAAFRARLLRALDDGQGSTGRAFRIAVSPAADSLGIRESLEHLGWDVAVVGAAPAGGLQPDAPADAIVIADADLDIRLLPRSIVTVAWLGDDATPWLGQPWFDEFDIVVTASDAVTARVREASAKVATTAPPGTDPGPAIRSALIAWASSTRYGLLVGLASWEVAERWGDYHFARAIQRSLERAGHPTRLHFEPDWTQPVTAREDVTVHLFGLRQTEPRPSQINLLWQISHPDLASPELYDRYDHVFVASTTFAARMTPLSHVPVTALHQATDPERFWPDPTGPAHELLFVGNSRNIHRRIIDDLADTPHDLAIYGSRWRPELVDPRFVKGERIPNAELRRYYSSAAIVLNDHWDDMRAEGFLSNRLYDALACGSFVISDHVVGIDLEFDDAVVTYRDRADLAAQIDLYLKDEDERHRRGELGRAAVLERHTFDARTRVLMEAVAAIERSRQADPTRTPTPAAADRPLP